jgi:peptide/nickel transport system substrate-binding protein
MYANSLIVEAGHFVKGTGMRFTMKRSGGSSLRRRAVAATLSCVVIVGSLAACTGKSHTTTNTRSTSSGVAADGSFTPVGTKTSGGTVTWAQQPGNQPNYIFGIWPAAYCSVVNILQFQPLMYRPLYWGGNQAKAKINLDYSIGKQPMYSDGGRVVTVELNSNYIWSNGEPVSARDVVFNVNLIKANKDNFCAYVPGEFPDNVVDVKATGPTTVQFTMDKAYNPDWLLYNELSLITPMPLAWDKTSDAAPSPKSDTGNLPDTTDTGAKAVFKHLDGLSRNTSTYAGNPIWGVVDGPWRLKSFTSTGEATFVPNPSYGGPVKPTISEFKEVPFTSGQAEVNVARTGPSNLTIGYLPADSLAQLKSLESSGYKASSAYVLASYYFFLNQHNPTLGAVFRQQYFREAFQHLANQPGWIKAFLKGYGQPTTGMIPNVPTNDFVGTTTGSSTTDFDAAKSTALLKDHGWNVVPNGTTTCAQPGAGDNQCGAGVAKGQALSFTLNYVSGISALDSEMRDLKSEASGVGIQITLTKQASGQVLASAGACKATEPSCKWAAANLGSVGWVYAPDFYPSGDNILLTGAAGNFANYSDPTMDKLIKDTEVASADQSKSSLTAYNEYVQKQLPVVFQPAVPSSGGPTLVSNHLGGYAHNAYAYLTPEQYYLTR